MQLMMQKLTVAYDVEIMPKDDVGGSRSTNDALVKTLLASNPTIGVNTTGDDVASRGGLSDRKNKLEMAQTQSDNYIRHSDCRHRVR